MPLFFSKRRSPYKQNKWRKKQKVEWTDGKPDDIVVAVLGQAGVGKSTFVKHLITSIVADTQTVEYPVIGNRLQSCTKYPRAFPIPIKNQKCRLVILDTPGFDDAYIDELEILERIAQWLASCYSENMKLAGIVYLHDLSQPRMLGSAIQNFEMLQALCGKSVAKSMILCLAKSEELALDVAQRREEDLRSEFWKSVIDRGARVQKFKNTQESAWTIVNLLLGSTNDNKGVSIPPRNDDGVILDIQTEMVEMEKTLLKTAAGRKLHDRLEEIIARHKQRAERLNRFQNIDEITAKQDLETIELLEEKIRILDVPDGIWERFRSFFKVA